MNYTHLTQTERYQIYAFKKIGYLPGEIAQEIGRDPSTIYRELNRNTGEKGYRPKQAQETATERLKNIQKAIKMTKELIQQIDEKIRLNWSPEQISGRLFKEKGLEISHERIYQHILDDKKKGGSLHKHLRCQKKRKKRYGTKAHDRRGQIPNKVSIEERPAIVETKSRTGDWEGDLVIGKNHKNAIVTLVDRQSKKVKFAKVKSKKAAVVETSICRILKGENIFTLTFDNGKEFSNHESMANKLNAKIYFAHPYSSYERGLNENSNGLLRQYFPKGSCFELITDKDIKMAEDALNNRPRKSLGFNTPNEIYSGERRVPRQLQ